MSYYYKRKEQVRDEAIEFQLTTAQEPMYWSEVVDWCNHFCKLGKRYGLLREFRENAIC